MLTDALEIAIAIALVMVNGFFVAAEFAFVKARPHRIETLVRERRAFATSALRLSRNLDGTLAACQLGITMASLALGWVGEPAFARLLEPVLTWFGVESQAVLHGVSFVVAFTLITALHLVAGEQVPKIFAIRRPEPLALWCAVPLRAFCVVSYPLLVGLSRTTALVLRWLGVEGPAGHEAPHSEEEIRTLLRHARTHGELSSAEHRLLDAVFEFDDIICRRVMVPRSEVVFFDVKAPLEECLERVRRTKHTRYPVCEGSLDKVLGVVHLKDLIGVPPGQGIELSSMMRPPRNVPESMPISRLLRHFQAMRQHMAFVLDEYGTVIGIVTLENVLEQIVGPVEDEFDAEEPVIVPEGEHEFVILGSAPIEVVNARLGLRLQSDEADTLSGLLTVRLGRILSTGDVVELDGGVTARVLDARAGRASKVRVRLPRGGAADAGAADGSMDGGGGNPQEPANPTAPDRRGP